MRQHHHPSRKQRWCCDVLKFGPLTEWALANHVSAFLTGIRRAESSGRAEYLETDWNLLVLVRQLNPLLDWSAPDIWGYIGKYGLPVNRAYEYQTRIGCRKPEAPSSVREAVVAFKPAVSTALSEVDIDLSELSTENQTVG